MDSYNLFLITNKMPLDTLSEDWLNWFYQNNKDNIVYDSDLFIGVKNYKHYFTNECSCGKDKTYMHYTFFVKRNKVKDSNQLYMLELKTREVIRKKFSRDYSCLTQQYYENGAAAKSISRYHFHLLD